MSAVSETAFDLILGLLLGGIGLGFLGLFYLGRDIYRRERESRNAE